MQGQRHQCRSRQCKSLPTNVFLLEYRPVVAQCVERLQHFKRTAVRNFNVADSFPSGACGSLGCHSVASPPRCRPWRLSPLVVQMIISMIVLVILCVLSLNADDCFCTIYYYVLLILSFLLYRILIPFIFITAFGENMGRAFIRHTAAAKAQVLLRQTVVRSSVIFQREPKTLHQA